MLYPVSQVVDKNLLETYPERLHRIITLHEPVKRPVAVVEVHPVEELFLAPEVYVKSACRHT